MTNAVQFAGIIRSLFLMLAFSVLIIAWVMKYREKPDTFTMLRFIVFNMVIIALISSYYTLVAEGTAIFNSESEKVSGSARTFISNVQKINIEDQGSAFSIFPALAGWFLDAIGLLAYYLRFGGEIVQGIILVMMYAISPLLLSLLAIPHTQQTGIKFMLTTFSIMLWGFGCAMADLFFVALYDRVVSETAISILDPELTSMFSAMNNAVIVTISSGMFIGIGLIVYILMIIIAPTLITFMLSGGSPGNMISSSMQAGAGLIFGATMMSRGASVDGMGGHDSYDGEGEGGDRSVDVSMPNRAGDMVGHFGPVVSAIGMGGIAEEFKRNDPLGRAGPMMGLPGTTVDRLKKESKETPDENNI